MTKREIDSLIADMKKGSVVTKAAPWMIEGRDEMLIDVRYVGIKPEDWEEVVSPNNNLMIRFTHTRGDSRAEFLIANKLPFFKFWTAKIDSSTKWEPMLGIVKNMLKTDKEAVIHHKDKAGNLFKSIQPFLR